MRAFFGSGADERNRTSDLLITNQLLYQLSYISKQKTRPIFWTGYKITDNPLNSR